jgi:hypothetical protein
MTLSRFSTRFSKEKRLREAKREGTGLSIGSKPAEDNKKGKR